MLAHQHADGGRGLAHRAVGRCQHVPGREQRAAAPGSDAGAGHQTHLAAAIHTTQCSLSPTCQGYSFTSVSTPPTILVCLWAMPQLQVELVAVVVVVGATVVVPLEIIAVVVVGATVVVAVVVVVVVGGGVVVARDDDRVHLRTAKPTLQICVKTRQT